MIGNHGHRVINLDYLAHTGGRDAAPEYLLSNSFGFGGINASLLFRRA